MILHISSFGIGSVYTVDFEPTDTESLDKFLASKDVYPSDRQVKLFASKGECVEFTRSRGKTVIKTVVTDITESERRILWRKKARGVVERWNADKNTNRMINMLMKFDPESDIARMRRVVALKDKWDAKVEKLVVKLDAM